MPLHWTHPQSEEREVILVNSTLGDWRDWLQGRASAWSGAPDIRVVVADGQTSPGVRETCPYPENYRRVRVCSFQYGFPNAAGKAQVELNTANGHIQVGRARLDNQDLGPLTNSGIRHIICQEIGHTLGLDHWVSQNQRSCMNNLSETVNDPDYDGPAQHDYVQIGDQTHHHGGVGANADFGDPLNGDLLDCIPDLCVESTASHIRLAARVVVVSWNIRIPQPERPSPEH